MDFEPRGRFAERFALLYAEAGDPPLKRTSESVTRARRVDERGRPVGITAQRVSDWRRGRNVPARFAGLATVLEILIGEARKRRAGPIVPDLYDLAAWKTLWQQALASPIPSGEESGGTERHADACPYRGLASFRQQDAGWFFGRARSTETLVARLAGEPGTGLTMLVGASGAGKSSLIAAGLLPALGEDVVAVTMTPRDDPAHELTTRIPELGDAVKLACESAEFSAAIRDGLAEHLNHQDRPVTRLTLVIDQFEEIFTLCLDEHQRRLFIRTLHTISTNANAVVLLGLRADFYGHCLEHAELADALQHRQQVLGPMTTAELRDAISGPAKSVGLQLEAGLVDLIVRDVGAGTGRTRTGAPESVHDAGVLPLLSHALLATWQRRQPGTLTIEGYRATRGIQGAVAATAERAWAKLDQPGQAATRAVLLRLVRVGEDMRDTRRRSTREQLVEHAEDPLAAEKALEVLTTARLVTADTRSVEITHEALLQAWPRLRSWIDQDRAGNLLRQRLEEDAASWDTQERESSLLYRGARLETATHWLKTAGPTEATVIAREFLTSSSGQHRRSKWARRAAMAAVVVFALIAASTAVVALRQRDDAQFQQVVSEADRALATDPSLAARLDLVAHQLRPDDRNVISKLLSTQQEPLATPMTGHNGSVYWTGYRPDGNVLATASLDRTVRLWDVHDRTHPRPLSVLTGAGSWIASAVFTPDGRTLVTAGDDHMLRLWDVADPAHPRAFGPPVDGQGGTMYTATVSPDGHTVATASSDHVVRLWGITDPARPVLLKALTGHTGLVRTVAFSPDGRTLASSGNDTTIRLWNVTDPTRATPRGQPIAGHTATVHSVAFSPDGRLIASGSEDGTVRLWNVTAPGGPAQLGQPLAGGAWQLAFSPDGAMLATNSDGAIQLWNLSDPAQARVLGEPLKTSNGGVFSAMFSPDGHSLAIGSADGTVSLWSLPEPVLLGRTSISSLTFSPARKLMATAAAGYLVRLWDVTDVAHPRPVGRPITGHGTPTYGTAATFSPDGRILAASSDDNHVQLWNIDDPANPVALGPPLPMNTKYGTSALFSPDGHFLATSDDDQTQQLWDVRNPVAPVRVGHPLTGHLSAFSPDGHLIATADDVGAIQLWNIAGAEPTPAGPPVTGHTARVVAMAFSHDGHTLATGSDDQTLRLWNITDPSHPAPLGRPLEGHTQSVGSVAFSPDDQTIVTGSADRTFRLWAVSDSREATALGLPISTGVDLHVVAFSPGRDAFLATGDGDGTVRLWNLDERASQRRICASTNGVLTPAQAEQHIPQITFDPPCG